MPPPFTRCNSARASSDRRFQRGLATKAWRCMKSAQTLASQKLDSRIFKENKALAQCGRALQAIVFVAMPTC